MHAIQPRRLYTGRFFDQVLIIAPRSGGRKSIITPNCTVCGRPVQAELPVRKSRHQRLATGSLVCETCCPQAI
jgi:hypothetical protein